MNHEGGFFVLPRVTMNQEKTSVFVGVAKLDNDLKLKFEPQPEFAEQFNRDNKKDEPPPPAGKGEGK
jgi:hypothetical protein